MPSISIDGIQTTVPDGATILDAAIQSGIEIPTLCFLNSSCKNATASTSCLVCSVKVGGKIVPACATVVIDRMCVESETDEIHSLRRTALELLLSDHVGDCYAPCQFACPAKMDIPNMLRYIQSGDIQA
ncbi:MAG: 2Fe-2S iron-sulfur cluster-binding protein, partial [Thermoguttaceae bacterium]